ncbi:TrbC/VirB2 family protein [Enterococcus hirae]|nr:TrbC/VirB2 family protein [Enterococcus hirae]
MIQLFLQTQVLGAVDIFQSITTAANNLKNSLMVIAPIIAVVSIIIGGAMFFIGRRQVEQGKERIFNTILGIIIAVAATSIVLSVCSMFGMSPSGI